MSQASDPSSNFLIPYIIILWEPHSIQGALYFPEPPKSERTRANEREVFSLSERGMKLIMRDLGPSGILAEGEEAIIMRGSS